MDAKLKTAFDNEMSLGKQFFSQKKYEIAFSHFERAHILGQFFVWPHFKSHIWMFLIGIRTGNFNEIGGQLLRLPLAIIGSALGKVPRGNTGGANVKLTSTMPIPKDLQEYLESDEKNE